MIWEKKNEWPSQQNVRNGPQKSASSLTVTPSRASLKGRGAVSNKMEK